MDWCNGLSQTPAYVLTTTFFVSVASNLGVGILGLPTTLHSTGFWPFLFMFTITLFAQLGVIYATTELFAHVYFFPSSTTTNQNNYEELSTVNHEEAEAGEQQQQKQENQNYSSSHSTTVPPEAIKVNKAATLHDLSQQLLPTSFLRNLFEFLVLAHFVAILASYGLAGPQALQFLLPLSLSLRTLITIFISTCAAIILIILPFIQSLTSIGTAVKCILLFGLIAICFSVQAKLPPSTIQTNWTNLMGPFLMGSVALGGVANVMPVTWFWYLSHYQSSPSSSNQQQQLTPHRIQRYRTTVSLAVVLCFTLNLLWCYTILQTVPQAALQSADTNGQISTIPLVNILQTKSSSFQMNLLTNLVKFFIAISVTVSFLVIGAGLYNYITGISLTLSTHYTNLSPTFLTVSLSLFWFGVILALSVLNPKGFMVLLEGFTSLALNMEAGLFLIGMFYWSRVGKENKEELPGRLGNGMGKMIVGGCGVFYGVTFVVDCVYFAKKIFE